MNPQGFTTIPSPPWAVRSSHHAVASEWLPSDSQRLMEESQLCSFPQLAPLGSRDQALLLVVADGRGGDPRAPSHLSDRKHRWKRQPASQSGPSAVASRVVCACLPRLDAALPAEAREPVREVDPGGAVVPEQVRTGNGSV